MCTNLSVSPLQGINPIELGNVAVAEILKRFYADFPPHPMEKDYNFTVSSSMKPTQVGTQVSDS
jgi:acetylornithine deacetylase